MRKYKRRGIGAKAVNNIWTQFKGRSQVRVLVSNQKSFSFLVKNENDYPK